MGYIKKPLTVAGVIGFEAGEKHGRQSVLQEAIELIKKLEKDVYPIVGNREEKMMNNRNHYNRALKEVQQLLTKMKE